MGASLALLLAILSLWGSPMPDTFEVLAVRYMRALVAEKDFGFSEQDAAAVLGNAGHESAGFRLMQEVRPRAGRGGLGAFQWTGPRRVAFEAWCATHKCAPASFEAGYGFLVHELRTSEHRAVGLTKGATGLRAKVVAFELGFERAGVKAYDSRLRYAQRALAAFRAAPAPGPDPVLERVAAIKRIQTALRALGFDLAADGDLGPATKAAVHAFQASYSLNRPVGGLAIDGIPGPATTAALLPEPTP